MNTLLQKLFDLVNVQDLPGTNELAKKGARIGTLVTTMVATLKDYWYVDNHQINELASLFWDLVGSKMVPIGATDVPTVSIFIEKRNDINVAVVLAPMDFEDQCKKSIYMQFGAMVFAASQARDWYNDRIMDGKKAVHARAWAYEAEWLLTAKKKFPDFVLNEYQQKVLQDYPEGLKSLPAEYAYESKPFVKGESCPLPGVKSKQEEKEYDPWQ